MHALRNIFSALIGLLAAVMSWPAVAEYGLNLTSGVTPISQEVHHLHMIIFYICVAIGVLVFGIMFYALLKHRKSRNHKAADFHENTTLEIFWTVIPLLILVGMAFPATRVLLDMADTKDSDLTIQVTGYQWKWKYDYLAEDISFFSNLSTPADEINNIAEKNPHYLREVDKPLVVPTGRKIRFLFTSDDVIHAWWVPDLGFKRDTIPGFINENWATIEKPGIYRGQCAELCGIHHGFMPIVVDARSPEDYDKWVQDTKASILAERELASKVWTKDELFAKGEEVYKRTCAACHQASGEGMPPMFPALKGSKVATGDINHHMDIVLHGINGTAMQGFAAQLNETEIAAVITYERNAWGNNVGDMVQPLDVKKRKDAPAP